MTTGPTRPLAASDDPSWPVLHPDAYYGVAGDLVRVIEPETEADPVGLLINALIGYGSVIGATLHALVGQRRHHVNLFAAQIGESGKGRKGTGWAEIRAGIQRVDPVWVDTCIEAGLSTGEGLINRVRDPDKAEKGEKTGPLPDRRVLVVEEEFGNTIKMMNRENNSLSGVLRQAWDGGTLRVMTRGNPLVSTGAHVSILGHVTRGELQRLLSENDTANGFANRFLWIAVRRTRFLEEGGNPIHYGDLTNRLFHAMRFATEHTTPVRRDNEARTRWANVYPRLAEGQPGLIGAITGRGEAQTLRLSLLYAALDLSPVVRVQHLDAALAVWRYCEDSARYIFGDTLGDPVADTILTALRDAVPQSVSTTDLHAVVGRHQTASRIRAVLRDLEMIGEIAHFEVATGGRPRVEWMAR